MAIEALRADLLVAVPTETVYGLACLNDTAVDRLLEAKGRAPARASRCWWTIWPTPRG